MTSPRLPGGSTEKSQRPSGFSVDWLEAEEERVIVVAGHLVVDPGERGSYLAGCVPVVEQARQAPGCLDFALSADLLDPGRINIFERWVSTAAVEAFRGSGPSDDQSSAVQAASVAEYEVAAVRRLT